MFGIIVVTSVLEFIIFMPISFTILQFFLPKTDSFLMSCVLSLIALFACWLCKLELRTFLYRIISLIVAVLLAYFVAQLSIGTAVIAALCIFVFVRVKSDINSGRDIGMPLAIISILINIPLALINVYGISNNSTGYSNATIFISTIASVILVIFKQVDESRRFGKNTMDIGNTQRKNNRIFAVVFLVLLLAISSIGQVSKLYSLVLNIFRNFFKLLAYIFASKSSGETPQQGGQIQDILGIEEATDPSIFDIIVQVIINVVSVIIILALIGFVVYFVTKKLIKLIKWIINWLKNGEQTYFLSTEDGHIDERHSLYNRNLRNMAKRLRDSLKDLLDREVPYNKLPNDIAKVRRLFKKYKDKALQEGTRISSSSTSEEICTEVSNKEPETEQLNNLLSKCYDAARYGEVEPSPQELVQLENKLQK